MFSGAFHYDTQNPLTTYFIETFPGRGWQRSEVYFFSIAPYPLAFWERSRYLGLRVREERLFGRFDAV